MSTFTDGYKDIETFIPKGVDNLESLKKALIQYSFHIGPKGIPKELIPYDFPEENSIAITDGSKKLLGEDEETFNILSPVNFEKRIAHLSKTTDFCTEKIQTDHFGKKYKATSTTFYSKENGHPVGKMVLYHPSRKQKTSGNFFHPDFTFELIGYDKEFGQRISVGVTSYRNRDSNLLIYSAFEGLAGARIDIGCPKWLPQFTKRLAKVFKLGQ